MTVCSPLSERSIINAAPVSGVTGAVAEIYEATNETNEKGKVIGATKDSTIYEDKACTKVENRVYTNQIVRALELDPNTNIYTIQYGSDVAYVKAEDFVSGDKLLKYVVDNPDWFKRNAVITEDTTAYDWVTGGSAGTIKSGEKYPISSESDNYYTVISTSLDNDDNEVNTLINVDKDSARLEYDIRVTSYSDGDTKVSNESLDVVELACSLVGTPYVWGGTDPATGVDCSGFVQYVYKQFGYSLPRCSWQQAEIGTRVSFDDLKPGDLIFYQRGSRIGHVTMYIGDGQCVQARSRHYGVCITPYDYSTPLYAVRILK